MERLTRKRIGCTGSGFSNLLMTTWTELNRHRAIFPLQQGTTETKHGVSNVLCVLALPNTHRLPGMASVSLCLAGLGQIKMRSGRVGDKCIQLLRERERAQHAACKFLQPKNHLLHKDTQSLQKFGTPHRRASKGRSYFLQKPRHLG